MLQFICWTCLVIIMYAYVGYPLLAALMGRRRRRPEFATMAPAAPVSLIMAVHNEAGRIGARLHELSALIAEHHGAAELIVVCDGCTDGTAGVARQQRLPNVRVVERTRNQGKAAAINVGVAHARHATLVFADCRQTWARDAVRHLTARLQQPGVTAVSGDLELCSPSGELVSVGFYWRLEKWLRCSESDWKSSIGVTGAICAARRSHFPELPAGAILDDVYWPMHMVLQGGRVVHERRAKAFDALPPDLAGEYARKIRTLVGNFQLLVLLPALLLPWRNPVWWQFVSHKLLRLLVPWCFLAAWLASALLVPSPLYALGCAALSIGFLVGMTSWMSGWSGKSRWLGIPASLCAMNCAAWLAFWLWVLGRTDGVWKRVKYAPGDAS